MQEHLIELNVGDTLQVGPYRVTLLGVNGDELNIEVDGHDGDDWQGALCGVDFEEMVDSFSSGEYL